jgi:hypothetical protein
MQEIQWAAFPTSAMVFEDRLLIHHDSSLGLSLDEVVQPHAEDHSSTRLSYRGSYHGG